MFETLKILHMAALMGGGAGMIGNGLLLKRVMAAGGPPPPMVADTRRIQGFIGLASIVLLWLTGFGLSFGSGYVLDWQYVVKLAGATLVLVKHIA